MHQLYPNTTILLFLRSEREETRAKSLRSHFGARSSMRMVRALNRHAIRVSRQSGLPVLIIQGEQQIGDTFGERFAHAFEVAFQAGYEHVIAIGNDCLTLGKAQLLQAAQLLNAGAGIVIGPAKDGGAYIVSISRAAYQRAAFVALPWQTHKVLGALYLYANRINSRCELLPTAADADHAEDFQKALFQMPATVRIIRLLRDILLPGAFSPRIFLFLVHTKFSSVASLRAPPMVG